MAGPPDSYSALRIPEISFEHVPASSPTPTPVVVLRLDRPDAKNAFTDTMVTSLVRAFDLLSFDPRVRAVVFTGADPRNRIFCPGMDLDGASSKTDPAAAAAAAAAGVVPLPDPAELERARAAHRDGGAQVSLAIYRCAKPVVAALNGHAVGVGITMTLPCNLRVASRDARVGFVFSRRGINMEACSSFFLPRILGAGRALELTTTGATYPTTHPSVRGLFADVVEPARVLPRALELAREIAARTSAVSTRVMKDMIYRGAQTPEDAALLESRVFFDLFRGKDSREGIRSFLEKREPDFTGQWELDKPTAWPWWDTGAKSKL